MSLRLEMLQVARLAPRLLGDSSELVAEFFRSQMNPDGGFKDRSGNSDLYYTVFGIEGLFILRAELPLESLEKYLRTFGDGAGLDLVHLGCLARCWAMLPPNRMSIELRQAIAARVESYRSADGGYEASPRSKYGTLYSCFIAMGAYQDLDLPLPNPQRLLNCTESLRANDGGYANQRDVPQGLTPSTAAAVVLLHQLQQPIDEKIGHWLLSRVHPQGGFFATPAAPIPDLLSTATALHALSIANVDITGIREQTLDFIDTLWSSRGGFLGTWEDDVLDCEYTWYGLLALGHLSV